MTAPLSLQRVKDALRRIAPALPSFEPDTMAGKELDSIALVLARAADRAEAVLEELFPDGAVALLDRWESMLRLSLRPDLANAARQARLLAITQRIAGAQLDKLRAVLEPTLALSAGQLVFVEALRADIEAALTVLGPNFTASTTQSVVSLGAEWPGVVDDQGVKLTLGFASGSPTAAVSLTSPKGTSAPVTFTGSGTHWFRTEFAGEPAGGRWTLRCTLAAGSIVCTPHLMVSNDVDATQIYNFYALRDPSLPGTPDLLEAQRLFTRTALAQMVMLVAERAAARCDEAHSLCDRDPVGA